MKKVRVRRAIWKRIVCQRKKIWDYFYLAKGRIICSYVYFLYKLCIFLSEDKNEIALVMVKEYAPLVSRKIG